MSINLKASFGTRSAKKELIKICNEQTLNKFINADFDQLRGNISNVSRFFAYTNVKSQKAVENFADALNNHDNMKKFLNAIEKQAKSLGTKSSGLFYKLIYKNIHQKTKNNSDWTKIENALKAFEKEIRKFLLAKKDQDIEETEAPEDFEKLTDEEKKAEENRRKNHSNIIEKLQSSMMSDRLKVFMALVLWKYINEKIKECNHLNGAGTEIGNHSHLKYKDLKDPVWVGIKINDPNFSRLIKFFPNINWVEANVIVRGAKVRYALWQVERSTTKSETAIFEYTPSQKEGAVGTATLVNAPKHRNLKDPVWVGAPYDDPEIRKFGGVTWDTLPYYSPEINRVVANLTIGNKVVKYMLYEEEREKAVTENWEIFDYTPPTDEQEIGNATIVKTTKN